MRVTMVICLSLLIVANLYGQLGSMPKNEINVGGGLVSYEGKLRGANVFFECALPLKNYLSVVPSISSNLVLNEANNYYTHINTLGANLSARFIPFPKRFNRLKFDFGMFYQYLVKSDGATEKVDNNFSYVLSGYYERYHIYGLLLSLSINVIETEKFSVGIKGDRFLPFGTEEAAYASWNLGLFVGRRF